MKFSLKGPSGMIEGEVPDGATAADLITHVAAATGWPSKSVRVLLFAKTLLPSTRIYPNFNGEFLGDYMKRTEREQLVVDEPAHPLNPQQPNEPSGGNPGAAGVDAFPKFFEQLECINEKELDLFVPCREPVSAELMRECLSLCSKRDRDNIAVLLNHLHEYPQLVHAHNFAVEGAPQTMTTLLFTAARENNLQIVRALIRRGADPYLQVKNPSRSTPLHVACYRGYVAVVEALLQSSQYEYVDVQNQYNELYTTVFCKENDPAKGLHAVTPQEKAAIIQLVDKAKSRRFSMPKPRPPTLWFTCTADAGALRQRSALTPEAMHHIATAIAEGTDLSYFDGTVVHDLVMKVEDASIGLSVNKSRTLMSYPCTWYYVNDFGSLVACSASIHKTLQDAQAQGLNEVTEHNCYDEEIGEFQRVYHLSELFCENLKTQRRRPLLHIGEDGYGTFGSCVASWQLVVPGRVPKFLEFPVAEVLDGAFGHDAKAAQPTGPLALSANREALEVRVGGRQPGVGRANLKVAFRHQRNVDGLSWEYNGLALLRPPDGWDPVVLRRFHPSCFYLNERGEFASFAPDNTKLLLYGLVANQRLVRDDKCEYDLEFREMRSIKPPSAGGASVYPTPLIIGRPLTSAALDPVEAAAVPGLVDRIRSVADASALPPAHACLAIAAANGRPITSAAVRAVASTLIHRHSCSWRGLAVAEATVADELRFGGADASQPYDVEFELPRTVNHSNVTEAVEAIRRTLAEYLGCAAERLADQPVVDPISRVTYDAGRLLLRVSSFSTPLHVVLIPPWNFAEHPLRHVYFSAENLRITATAATLHQSVALGALSLTGIVAQVRRWETSPVMDFDCRSDGSVIPRDDISRGRKEVALARLEAMRRKGFTFVPCAAN